MLFNGASLTWEADEDCVLFGIQSTQPCVVSLNEELTIANWLTGIDHIDQNYAVWNAPLAGDQKSTFQLNIAVAEKSRICAVTAANPNLVQCFLKNSADFLQLG